MNEKVARPETIVGASTVIVEVSSSLARNFRAVPADGSDCPRGHELAMAAKITASPLEASGQFQLSADLHG
ncbi:hypothetical protein CVV67_18495 [Arthrobacter stackebrandtii]|nr:hypothetical protein CVV67_18495 [Arthrobacter stackebrandtii]